MVDIVSTIFSLDISRPTEYSRMYQKPNRSKCAPEIANDIIRGAD